MLLECIDGQTLQKWLSHERSKGEVDTVKESLDLAICKFHKSGWSHNCIYPRYILICEDLSILLIDLQRAERDNDCDYDCEHVERIWKKFANGRWDLALERE